MRKENDIRPIRKLNCVDQAFEQLRTMLFKGVWQPGEKIPSENELAKLFHVSRPTIRQAIQKLQAQNLLETRAGIGSYVMQFDVAEYPLNGLIPALYLGNMTERQVFEFREMVEIGSVKCIAEELSPQDILRMEEAVDGMEKAAAFGDKALFSVNDLLFHKLLVEATGNPLLIKTYQIMGEVLEKSMDKAVEKMGFGNLACHKAIMQALKNHDKEEAVRCMEIHFQRNYCVFSKEDTSPEEQEEST